MVWVGIQISQKVAIGFAPIGERLGDWLATGVARSRCHQDLEPAIKTTLDRIALRVTALPVPAVGAGDAGDHHDLLLAESNSGGVAGRPARVQEASELRDQLANGAEREEQPGGVGWQGLKAIALIKRLSPSRALGIAAIEHIEKRDSDAEGVGSLVDAAQCIHQQVGPKARSAVTLIATDHGNEGGGD